MTWVRWRGPTHGPAQLTGADTAHQLLAWSALPVGEPRERGMLADAAAILTCWQGRRKP